MLDTCLPTHVAGVRFRVDAPSQHLYHAADSQQVTVFKKAGVVDLVVAWPAT